MTQTARVPRRTEFVDLYGRSFYNPSIRSLCTQVAWATSYADPIRLDEQHPQWGNYFAYSEWFRHRICSQLLLPLGTEWADIYRLVGVLCESEYSSSEEARVAANFGESHQLNDEMTPIMFEKFEEIKYRITNRR